MCQVGTPVALDDRRRPIGGAGGSTTSGSGGDGVLGVSRARAGRGVCRIGRLGVYRPGVVGVTASGVVSRCGVLADVIVGDGVCPVWVANVAGSPLSGSCGVTMGVSPVTRVARSS